MSQEQKTISDKNWDELLNSPESVDMLEEMAAKALEEVNSGQALAMNENKNIQNVPSTNFDFSQLKQLDAKIKNNMPPEQVVTAIVKVKQENYHPELLSVRQQIDSYIFTAEFQIQHLETLQNDPLVESVALNTPLYSY